MNEHLEQKNGSAASDRAGRVVQPGPIEPPKAPVPAWLYALAVVVLLSAATAFGFFVSKRMTGEPEIQTEVLTEQADTTAAEQETAEPMIQMSDILSYTSVATAVQPSEHYNGTLDECWTYEGLEDDFTGLPAPNVALPPVGTAPLYVVWGVHIEPLEQYADGQFDMDLARMNRWVAMGADHGLHMTIQMQPPFTEAALEGGVTDVAAWADGGNEIAIHFHEDAQLPGRGGNEATSVVPYGIWLSTMHDIQVQIEELCDCSVTSWSGGNLYDRILDVGSELGMIATYDYKNPQTQYGSPLLTVVNPWTPAASGSDAALATFDPGADVVFIPSGVYPAHCSKAASVGRPCGAPAFTYVTKALYESMEAAEAGKVNVFHWTTHPSDFGAPLDDDAEFEAWEAWLSDVIDPLVKSGRIVPATFSEVAAAYKQWYAKGAVSITLEYLTEEEAAALPE